MNYFVVTHGDSSYKIHRDILGSNQAGQTRELTINPTHGKAANLFIGETPINRHQKVIFINDGEAITDKGFIKLREIGNPDEEFGDHNGTGARIMTLKANPYGVVFVSKREDGTIRAIKVAMTTVEGLKYPIAVAYDSAEKSMEKELKPFLKDFGKDFNIEGTWSATILLGSNAKQKTFKVPFSTGDMPEMPWEDQILHRFYSTPHDIFIKGKKVNRGIDLLGEVEKGKHWIRQGEDSHGKFIIHYVLSKDLPITAIMQDNEFYDVGKAQRRCYLWHNSSNVYQSCGLMDVQDELAILIELDDDYAFSPQDYRDRLTYLNTAGDVKVMDFVSSITTNIPDYIKAIIKKRAGERYAGKDVRNPYKANVEDVMKALKVKPKAIKNAVDGKLPEVDDNIDPQPNPDPRTCTCPECGTVEDYEVHENGDKQCNKCHYVCVKTIRKIIVCPQCGCPEYDKLKGGKECECCHKWVKPERKRKRSKETEELPKLIVRFAPKPFTDLEEHIVFAFVAGDTVLFDETHPLIRVALEVGEKAKFNPKDGDDRFMVLDTFGTLLAEKILVILSYTRDPEVLDKVIISHIANVLGDELPNILKSMKKGK